jgi:hypothetical protein
VWGAAAAVIYSPLGEGAVEELVVLGISLQIYFKT